MRAPLDELESTLVYKFADEQKLVRALTHRSSVFGRVQTPECPDNEQLEFLGDSILGFLVSEALFSRHASAREGELSRWKAHLVSAAHLYECGLSLDIGKYLVLGKGEERNGGRERKNLVANAVEALIASIYLDGGIAPARSFVEKHVLNLAAEESGISFPDLNHKSLLQEQAQALGLPAPRYIVVETSGPEHAKVFTVEARMGTQLSARAQGSSKKAASQRAAELLVRELASAHPAPAR